MCKIGLFYGLSSDNPQSTVFWIFQSDCREEVISKLVSNQMAYFICPVRNNHKINVFLGKRVCMKVLSHKLLNKLSYKEDFMLGARLLYANCGKQGISVLLLLCNVYSFEDYFPDTNTLAQMPFDYEEQTVFSYIKSLQRNEKKHKYTIKEYKENYICLDAVMNNLRNIIFKYLLEDCPNEQYQDILIKLFIFESDLIKHILFEGKILIIFVEQIVRKLNEYQTK